MAASVAAAHHMYLAYSDLDNRAVMLVEVYEQGNGLRVDDTPKQLIQGLNEPTHIHYCFMNRVLYVCDKAEREIRSYEISFLESGNPIAKNGLTMVSDIDCAGIHLDKFGRLFFTN